MAQDIGLIGKLLHLGDKAHRIDSNLGWSSRAVGMAVRKIEDATFGSMGGLGRLASLQLRSNIHQSINEASLKNGGVGYTPVKSDNLVTVMNSNTRQIIKALNVINSAIVTNNNKTETNLKTNNGILQEINTTSQDMLLRLEEIRDFLDKQSYGRGEKSGPEKHLGPESYGGGIDALTHPSTATKSKETLVTSLMHGIEEGVGIDAGVSIGKWLKGLGTTATGFFSKFGSSAAGAALKIGGGMAALQGAAMAGDDEAYDRIQKEKEAAIKKYGQKTVEEADKMVPGWWNYSYEQKVQYMLKKKAGGDKPYQGEQLYSLDGDKLTRRNMDGNKVSNPNPLVTYTSEGWLKNEAEKQKQNAQNTQDPKVESRTMTFQADKITFDTPKLDLPGIGGGAIDQSNRDRLGSGGGSGGGGTSQVDTGKTASDAIGSNYTPWKAGGPNAGSLDAPNRMENSSALASEFVNKGGFTAKAGPLMTNLMHDYNLTKEQAAGIVGNLGHESAGLVAGIQEGKPVSGRGGLGWAQWTGKRRREFEGWLQANHMSANDPKANYGFLRYELDHKYKYAIDNLRQTDNVKDATVTFERDYEGAGVKAYGSRLKYANMANNLDVKAEPTGATLSGPVPMTSNTPVNPDVTKANSDALAGKEINQRSTSTSLHSHRHKGSPVEQHIHNHSRKENSPSGDFPSNKEPYPAFDDMFLKMLGNSPLAMAG